MISIDLTKAQAIAHDMRRAARAVELAPLDDLISKQIPGGQSTAAEAQRQAVREKYHSIQLQIDSAKTPDELKNALGL
jgi:hypothetical protein